MPYRLLFNHTRIQHLSLRNCNISEIGAKKLGNAIGNINTQNNKLLNLNLSGNIIGDQGTIEIAKVLKNFFFNHKFKFIKKRDFEQTALYWF